MEGFGVHKAGQKLRNTMAMFASEMCDTEYTDQQTVGYATTGEKKESRFQQRLGPMRELLKFA